MKTRLKFSLRWLPGLARHAGSSLLFAGLMTLASAVAHAGDYVLVVDTSGSMTGRVSSKDKRIRIEIVQQALRDYLPALPPSSRVHLLAFNSGIVAEKELVLAGPTNLSDAFVWVACLRRFAEANGGTHLWTTLRKALKVASDYSAQNPNEPVIVRVLTDGEDNEHVTSLDAVLKEFPLVDGEHIRGNLVLLGDLEFKTKLNLPEGAFEPTRSVHWADLFTPVILSIPAQPKVGEDVRFVENTKSIYSTYEWLIDGQIIGTEKVLTWRFTDTHPHRVILKVKGLDGDHQSSVLAVSAIEKPAFIVELVIPKDSIQPGETMQLAARPSEKALRYRWEINGTETGSNPELVWQPDRECTYEVKLTVWDTEGREASQIKRIAVVEAPLTLLIKGPQEATSGQSVQFAAEIAGPLGSLEWDFGNGAKSSQKDPLHTFNVNGSTAADFKVTLRAVTPSGRMVEATAHTIRVQALTAIKPPVADFTVIETKLRAGDELHLVDASQGQIDTWDWDITGEPSVQTRSPVIRPTTAGEKTVTLTVRGPGGIHAVSRKLLVQPRFTPVRLDVAASAISGTAPLRVKFINRSTGDAQAWRWNFGDGHTSTERSPEHEYATSGNYVANVTAIPADPAAAPLEQKITITAINPWPLWTKILLTVLAFAALGAIAWEILRRRREARLRLPVYYWAHDSNVCQRLDFTRADESRDLSTLQLRVRRIGSSQDLVAEALNGTALILPDGQEEAAQNLGAGSRLTVRLSTGARKAVAIAVHQKPRRPQPPPAEPSAISDPVPTAAAVSDEAEINWGWENSSAK
ncbi:MAG: PKD domain-containing protein [Opitutaceae bacterium]|jgi:PKD repeat protein